MGERLRYGFREKLLDFRDAIDYVDLPPWWTWSVPILAFGIPFLQLPPPLRVLVLMGATVCTAILLGSVFIYLALSVLVNGLTLIGEDFVLAFHRQRDLVGRRPVGHGRF